MSEAVATDGLKNDQERTFVTAYLRTGSVTQAGREAGLNFPGQAGSKWLKKPHIRAAIDQELRNKHIDEVQVLAELSEIAYVTMADFMGEDGGIDPDKVRRKGHLVRRYRCKRLCDENGTRVYILDLELHDRHAALVDVGRKYRMFGDDSINLNLYNVLVQAADEELPKELAGRLLARVAEGLRLPSGA